VCRKPKSLCGRKGISFPDYKLAGRERVGRDGWQSTLSVLEVCARKQECEADLTIHVADR
jgi:hypothetical protein